MTKKKRRCRHCCCLFPVCHKVKKHEYCNKKPCQKARKRKWQKERIKNNEIYRNDQKAAQQDWKNNNPDYWKNYRRDNKTYTDRNREQQRERNRLRKAKFASDQQLAPIAKMDALSHENKIISGKYELIPVRPDMIAKMDALIVEINTISSFYAYSGP